MQVFKAFFKIANRNKKAVLIYMGIFFALSFLLSSAGAKNDKTSFSQEALKIGVENRDKGELGAELKEYLGEKNKVQKIPKEREKLLDAMYYEKIDYVLIIPEDFSEKFLAGEREKLLEGTIVPGSSVSYLAETQINQFLTTLALYTDGGYEPGEAAEQTRKDMQKESRVGFLAEDGAEGKPAVAYYFQYLAYIFLCIMIISLGIVLMGFNKKDVDARNKCSAMSFTSRNLQMILASIVLMLIEYALFMVVACFMYTDYMLSVKGLLCGINALAYMLLCLSMAFLIGRIVRSSNQLDMLSNVLGLGFSFLGGVFVPLEIMSSGIAKVARFVPSYWYVINLDEIQKVRSLSEAGTVYKNCFVIAAFAAAILALGMLINRMKARTN